MQMDDKWDYGLNTAQQDAVKSVLERLERKKINQMHHEMKLMLKNSERRVMRFSDGNGGEVQFQVHPMSYHYWGRRLGYQCWQDREFVQEYLRDVPEARVRNIPSQTSIIVPALGGLAACATRKRFHKTYEEKAA
jgi:hypothetical protein